MTALHPIRLYIIDDHADVRRALAARLSSAPELQVMGHSGEAEASLLEVARLRPEVVLVETKRADGRGLEIVSWVALNGHGTQVFVLTSYASEWERWAARRAGAQRYFLKDIDTSQLVEQIVQAVAQPV